MSEVPEKIKGTPLEKAFLARQAAAAAGIKPSLTVTFTPEEAAVLFAGVDRTDVIEGKSARAYVKKVALAQAALDAAKPKQERKERSAEEIQAEIDKLTARLAKKSGS